MSALATSDLDAATEALAARMVTTIQGRDAVGWGEGFATDAVCWHSYDGKAMPVAENVEMLRGLFEHVVSELRYDDVRRYAVAGGYVQQHKLFMRAGTGATYTTGVCVVMQVAAGRIVHMSEYLDSSIIRWGMDNAPSQAGS